LCDLREDRLREVAESRGIAPSRLYSDAREMLARTRPDVFCFITPPTVSRLAFTEMAAEFDVGAVAMEKPMAASLGEAAGIARICRESGIRGVVSHQQKYLTSLRHVRETAASGRIGPVAMVTASCQAALAQLGTHFVDYALWATGFPRAEWVVGHVHGREMLADSHASPNYVAGQVALEGGVRLWVEFGKLSRSTMGPERYWLDNRLTVYGDRGYAWGETDGRWGALIDGEVTEGQAERWSAAEPTVLQPLYLTELADWLDGAVSDHSCNVEHAYAGYEIMEALCISAMDHVRVDLPLDATNADNMTDRMRRELPECPERT
jgi:predicted dehydrogenase